MDWGSIAQWVSVPISLAAFVASLNSSWAWKKTIKENRAAALLVAAYDLAGTIGKFKAAVQRKVDRSRYGLEVDALYARLLELKKSFAVAKRSFGDLEEGYIVNIQNKVEEIHENTKILFSENGKICAGLEINDVIFNSAINEVNAFIKNVEIYI